MLRLCIRDLTLCTITILGDNFWWNGVREKDNSYRELEVRNVEVGGVTLDCKMKQCLPMNIFRKMLAVQTRRLEKLLFLVLSPYCSTILWVGGSCGSFPIAPFVFGLLAIIGVYEFEFISQY